jgi:hypothetical protein
VFSLSSAISSSKADNATVDIEAEDIELGGTVENNLAMDIDGDGDSQPAVDALDSDLEAPDDELNSIDADETDSESSPYILSRF